ncbi:MAG: MmgE/PrpD family protein [Lachnospiraceae bacterium]|nr:MmgE/PrpD family protein [Lachnospiraceae bacterium]
MPKDSGQAKFSAAYGIAVALYERGFGVCHLNPAYTNDPKYLALTQKVKVEHDPEVQAQYPKWRGAKVCVHLKNGQKLQTEVYDLKGSPKHPVGFEELRNKFTANVAPLLSEGETERLIGQIMTLEQAESVWPLVEFLMKPVICRA